MSATSPEIEKIGSQLIKDVKLEFVKATTKKKITSRMDKVVFTMNEYFKTFADEKTESDIFPANEAAFIEDLIQLSETKHFNHLRYLSGKHAHNIMKLRFIHQPFSFIFLIDGNKHYHIIWETLDTEEATYIWRSGKSIPALKQAVRKTEDIINIINAEGKRAYIQSADDVFNRVFHDYSDLENGFNKWKEKLEMLLM